jgi:carboxylesterase
MISNLFIYIIVGFILLLVLWSSSLVFYRDKNTSDIESDEEKVFSPKCKSIILKHERKTNTAVLMIHGFPSTPSVYDYSANRFFEQGYDSYAYLLPGFGTDPDDFKKTYFTQWFNFICRKYENLQEQYENVSIVGISMGGALTLKLAEKYSDTNKEPLAAISISAPVIYNSLIKDRKITKFSFYFARIICLFKKYFNTSINNKDEDGQDGEDRWLGYSGLYLPQSISLIHAEKTIRKNLNKITCPLFSIHNVTDLTVPFFNFTIIAKENNSRYFRSKVIKMDGFKHTKHVLLLYFSVQEELTNDIIEFIEGRLDE